ncbi:MAG: RpiB/LacA/LacB family sugar-phosphate isomerase [Candidatus Nomurabacteria bacterium]|jgi:ribose 5-phosphate isomerase B|nr:RpiB/LacA/LacB family sugar-phosphate isomerase [Candidatus Nomurabacteria bacterium]
MKVFVGADHNGFHLKGQVLLFLQQSGYEAVDVGDDKLDPEDDFPQFAKKAALAVLAEGGDARAILLCGGGQGMCMAANRFKGIRASVIWDSVEARMTRNDNDSNVLCLPSRLLDGENKTWQDIIDTWLTTPFAAAARYVRRNNELDEIGG